MSDRPPRPVAVLVDREGLGDCLLKMPMLRALSRGFPGAPVWWIASHQTEMATTLEPYVASLVARTVAYTGITAGGPAARAFVRQLPRFDAVFDTRSRIASVARMRWQMRHRRFYCALPGFFLSSRRPPGLWARPRHIGERAMALARAALGPDADGRGALPFSQSARDIARGIVSAERPAIGLAIGSREARKNWPLESFIALATALVAKGLTPIFFIGPQEAAWRPALEARVPGALCLDFTTMQPSAPLGPLDPVLAIMEAVALVVANDGGLGHLAAAMDRPVVSLFGPTDPARWAPMARTRMVVRAQDFGAEAMDGIPVAAVRDAVESLLKISRASA